MSKDLYVNLAETFDMDMIPEGEDGINLGSVDEFFNELGVNPDWQDEYLLDEINVHLNKRGMDLVEDHTQLFLNKL